MDAAGAVFAVFAVFYKGFGAAMDAAGAVFAVFVVFYKGFRIVRNWLCCFCCLLLLHPYYEMIRNALLVPSPLRMLISYYILISK